MDLSPLPFTLRQLQYVAAVSSLKSFRRAAEACAVSQPALSAQLAQVERSLGVVLFERGRGGVLLTPQGRELLPRLERLLVDAADALRAARTLAAPGTGTLRLGVLPTISPYLLPRAAPELRRRHPGLAVRWVEEKTAGLLALLHEGEIDAAVLALEADLGDPARLHRELLFDDPFVLAAPKGHRLAAGRGPVRLHDLAGEEVLLLDEGHCFSRQALSLCTRAKARFETSAFRATSMTTLVQMAAAGEGITLLPRLAAEAETRRTGLVLRPFAEPAPHRTLALVHRKGDPGSTTASAVAASLRASGQAT